MPEVLIVEDDPNDAFFIQRAFELSGVEHRPHVCSNIADAKRYLQGHDEFSERGRFPFPTIMVVDIKMPAGSGLDLLAWIRDNPELRVSPTVIMSSSSRPEDVKLAYCLGANAYLCKPVESDRFREVFGALLQLWAFCEVPTDGTPSCIELIAAHVRQA